MAKKSNMHMLTNLNKTSSIFDIDQGKHSRFLPTGVSTTSFTHKPDEKVVGHRKAVFEPTYRLEPQSLFRPQAVKEVITNVLEKKLHDKTYDPQMAAKETINITSDIQKQVKRFHFSRYKFVVNVTIGEKTGQSIDISSRCCWNTSTDSMAVATYETTTLFAVATVFAVYAE